MSTPAWARCSRCDDVFPLLSLRPYRLVGPNRALAAAVAAGAVGIGLDGATGDIDRRPQPPRQGPAGAARADAGVEEAVVPVTIPGPRHDGFERAMLGLALGSLAGLGVAWAGGLSEPAGLAFGATFGVAAGVLVPWVFRRH